MNKSFIAAISLLVIASVLAGTQVRAQGARDWVDFEYTPQSVANQPGAVALSVAITIRDDWKMYAMGNDFPPYSLAMSFVRLPHGFADSVQVLQREPKMAFDVNFNKDVYYFQHEVNLASVLRLVADPNPGDSLRGEILYQMCSDSRGLCLPPTREHFSVNVERFAGCQPSSDSACDLPLLDTTTMNAGGGSLQAVINAASSTASLDSFDFDADVGGVGGLAFLLLAVGAGFGALLTPCVFPMIPLTVSFFSKQTDNRSSAVRMAMIYGASIVLTFTGLGVVMASIYGAAGVQTIASSPWVNLFFAAVLLFFALSLLGLFELRLPNGLLNYFNRQSNEKSGWLGVVFMGLTLTLVSFSCTAPFVGGLLAAAAQGSWLKPVIGMAAFSAAFALPFVLLALFPKALHALPRSGSWMNAMKVTLGFIELAASIKFLSNADLIWGWQVVSRPLAIAVTVVIFFLAGMYLIGKLKLKNEEIDPTVGVPRLITAIAFFGLGLYMIPGLLGAPLNSLDAFLPPRQATDIRLLGGTQVAAGLDDGWIVDDIDGALQVSMESELPVLVDFTGYTCTNCRQMESTVFPVPKVASLLERDFVRLRLYTDGQENGEDFQRYQLKLTGTVALPTYAILDASKGKLLAKTSGLQSADKFASFLERGVAAAVVASR